MASPKPEPTPGQPLIYLPSVRAAAEKKMGMLHSMSPANHGWHGDVRKRFTDFQVNERRKDGEVLHLTDYELGEQPAGVNIYIPGQTNKPSPIPTVAAPPAPEITDEDKAALQSLLGDATASSTLSLYDKTVASGNNRLDPKANSVKFPPMEREDRGKVHKEIRRIFDSRIETETDKDGVIVAVPAPPPQAKKNRRGGRNHRTNLPSFDDLGGEYLHFTLYKENKDTMDAVNQIGRIIKVRGNNFGFAGTKDRRAATVQRMSVHRVRHQVLDYLNSHLTAFKMGDYKYSKYPIELGDHGGNHFNITVKDVNVTRGEDWSLERRVQLIKQAVELAVTQISKYGFINYYGLQRFGTHVVGTHEIGMLMLKEDYEGVIDNLLHVDKDLMSQVVSDKVQETPMNRDEINRARAIAQFKTEKNARAALEIMPRRFHAETTIIEHLQKNSRDFAGAILKITRGMRNLYLHAYQSYVWNHAASHRWAKFGSKVIPGDLVLTNAENTAPEDLDEDDSHFQRARALSEEEANSGKYTIFDVVLPGPGFDIEYPKNEIGDFYVEFMGKPENGTLDPHRMRRPIKDFNISGNYRPLLGRFKGEPKWQVRTYVNDNEQMVPTDLDLIMIRKAEEKRKVQTQETAKPAGAVQRREDDKSELELRGGKRLAETSAQPSSKRIKLAEEISRISTPESADTRGPGQGGAPLWDEDNPKPSDLPQSASAVDSVPEASSNGSPEQLTAPIREPTVPNGTSGFASSKDGVSKDAPAEQSEDPAAARFGSGSIHSFYQPDLSKYSEDQIKIAVVLEFGLSTSAYATVVLRELMAEVQPEKPGSPLYPA